MESVHARSLPTLLEEMVSDPERIPVEKHPEWLQAIAVKTPHTISVLSSAEPLERYNCVMFALGIVERLGEEYPHPLLVAGTDLLAYLVKAGALKPCAPQPGAVVTWSSPEGIRHAGRMVSHDRAQSKWGLAHLLEHGLHEVPTRYGEILAFYSPIDPETVIEHWRAFVWGPSPDRP